MPGPKKRPTGATRAAKKKLLRFTDAEWTRLTADYLKWRRTTDAMSVTLADYIRSKLGLSQ